MQPQLLLTSLAKGSSFWAEKDRRLMDFPRIKVAALDTETNKIKTPQQYELPKLSSRHASGILIFPKLKLP